jgi:hypothetical protein
VSSAARDEAIEVVAAELEATTNARPAIGERWRATVIVDKLLETHAIVRRAPRIHRPARPTAGRSVVDRILEGGAG